MIALKNTKNSNDTCLADALVWVRITAHSWDYLVTKPNYNLVDVWMARDEREDGINTLVRKCRLLYICEAFALMMKSCPN